MAQQLEVNRHHLSCKGSKTISSRGARFLECTLSHLGIHRPCEKPLHLIGNAFEKVSLSVRLPSQVHMAWTCILAHIQGDISE